MRKYCIIEDPERIAAKLKGICKALSSIFILRF